MAGASADPTDGSSHLLALLGTAEGDAALAAYVASLHPAGARVSKPDVKRFPPSCAYVNHKAIGLSLCYEAGVLDAIHLYADGVDGFAGFRGDVPHGLRVAGERSTGKSVVEALGEPTSKGTAGGFVFVQYDALGVKLDLEAAARVVDALVEAATRRSTRHGGCVSSDKSTDGHAAWDGEWRRVDVPE